MPKKATTTAPRNAAPRAEAALPAGSAAESAVEPEGPAFDGFAGFELDERLLATVSDLGYEEPTPIQREAIPLLLAGRDILAEAPDRHRQDGRLRPADPPAHHRSARPGPNTTSALVVVPTRELAMQVAEAFHVYGKALGARVVPVYGGQPIGQQLRGLRRGVDVVVATPGRAVDHLKRGSLSFDAARIVVLDEADEMLDMGFAEDLDTILSRDAGGPPDRALLGHDLADDHADRQAAPSRSGAHHGPRREARPATASRASARPPTSCAGSTSCPRCAGSSMSRTRTSALVFARTRGEVDELAEALSSRGHDAGALHGGLAQEQRDRIMGRFRDGSLDVLVATDVAARGLDIEHVSHVVNYDVPSDPDAYVHRIGRTGRAGREGVAITLVEPREHRLLRNIERRRSRSSRSRGCRRWPTCASDGSSCCAPTCAMRWRPGGHDRFRGVVEPLAEEFDVVDIALAAVSLIEGAETRDEDEVELAQASLQQPGAGPGRGPGGPGGPGGPRRGGVPVFPRGGAGGGYRDQGRPSGGPGRQPRGPEADGWEQLWIGGGRRAGLRPGDLVGAIANEAGVPGSVVGAIQLFDDFALVDVQGQVADAVEHALRNATIRGQRLPVRRERSSSRR